MSNFKRTALGGAGFVVFTLAGSSVWAQHTGAQHGVVASAAIPEASSQDTGLEAAERSALGRQLATLILQNLDYKAFIIQTLQSNPATATIVRLRPDWSDMLVQSSEEAYAAQYPMVIAAVGDGFGGLMPLADLRAGAVFLQTPSGHELLRAMKEIQAKQPRTPFSASAAKDIAAFRDSPEGGAFLAHLSNAETLLPQLAKSFDTLAPTFLQKFGEKSERVEKMRIAALSPDTEAQLLGARLLRAVHFAAVFKHGVAEGIAKTKAPLRSPKLVAALASAMSDAMDIDEPQVERVAGRALAPYYTLAELHVGVPFLESPAGQALIAQSEGDVTGVKKRPLTRAQSLAFDTFAHTKTGAAFLKKFASNNEAITTAEPDILPLIMATAFRLAGERMTADQTKPG